MKKPNAFKKIVNDMARFEEEFLLETIGAKKEERVTKELLKNYSFICACCKQHKSATEAVILKKPLCINEKPKEDSIVYEVSEEMAVICQDCIKHLKANHEGVE